MGGVQCGTHCCAGGDDKQEFPIDTTKAGMPLVDDLPLVSAPTAAAASSSGEPEASKQGAKETEAIASSSLVEQEELKDTPTTKEASPGSHMEFSTRIARSKQMPIGMNFDIVDGVSLVVTDISSGAIRDWNDTHPGPECLEVNDRIVEANGVRGDTEAMLLSLKRETEWQLVVQRPEFFAAAFCRQNDRDAGVDLRYAPNGTSLVIFSVETGPLADWNAKGGRQIQKGDRIVEMNGVKGSSSKLLQAGKDVEELNVTIMHYKG
mmetsp:Transcript_139104/g.361440  ORF Transcript_139104/g.361440 Transcript_139104/m.361440 type:complete len:264 (+) Transcript_139104:89-880(+)